MKNRLNILYEDAFLIVCVKPPGVPSQGDRQGSLDMVKLLKGHLALSRRKAGEVTDGEPYLGVVHRLDRNVGGVMVYAKTKEAAGALSKELREHGFEKRYECIVEIDPMRPLRAGEDVKRLKSFLIPDGKKNLMRIGEEGEGALFAESEYRVLSADEREAHLEIRLLTGRKHQIRIQMTEISKGIRGDGKYHSSYRETKGAKALSLVCTGLSFTHPKTGERLEFSVPSNLRRENV